MLRQFGVTNLVLDEFSKILADIFAELTTRISAILLLAKIFN